MATYAIGDLQGCFEPFARLLKQLDFSPDRDRLWFCGDLVNRGPQSVDVLRWLLAHRDNVTAVLGNHDLHLLAVASGHAKAHRKDTLQDLLAHPERDAMLQFLHELPLYHQEGDWLLVHAGVPPLWSIETLKQEADFTRRYWQAHDRGFFRDMYGNEPALWRADLPDTDRARYCINALTRMRYVDAFGALELREKGPPGSQPGTLMPWFEHPALQLGEAQVIFGHWASLDGRCPHPQLHALDTGCVWGGRLTALALDQPLNERGRISVSGLM